MFYKRLEKDRFHAPRVEAGQGAPVATLAYREMALLLEGIDLKETRRRKRFTLSNQAI